MRKKIVTTLIVCLAMLLTAFGFTACNTTSDSVAGKTYVPDRTYLEFDETVSQEIKDQLKEYENTLNQLEDFFVKFETDGTLIYHLGDMEATGTYTEQNGEITTTINGETAVMKLKDGKLETRKDLEEMIPSWKGVTQVTIVKEKSE